VPEQTPVATGKRTGPIDRAVGAKVRSRRHGLGLSQTELGRAIGVTFQQIQKYENGTTRIGVSCLLRIAQALDVAPAWFFESASAQPPAASAQGALEPTLAAFVADKQTARLIRYWARLPPRIRAAIVNLVARAAGEPDGEQA